MIRFQYRFFALVLVLSLLFGLFAAMVPAEAQAGSRCIGGSAHFEPNKLPEKVTRDFNGECEWWHYELKKGQYVRVYSFCRYGNEQVSNRINHRAMMANYVTSQGAASQGEVGESTNP